MGTPSNFLHAIGAAVMDCVGDSIVKRDIVMINALPNVAHAVWETWAAELDERERRRQLKQVALLPADVLRPMVHEIVRSVAANRSHPVRQVLTTYLCLVPSQIRQALRRLSDPTGTTIPSKLMPRNSEQLLIFLPIDIPIFEPGDRPLPGVDWVLTELLGVGGFGEVWRADNPHFTCVGPVVLKFYLGRHPGDNQAFLHEAAILNRALPKGYHPGLVHLRTTYLAADPPCLEYEYIGDGDLTRIIQDHGGRGGLNVKTATRLLRQLAATVGDFHRMSPPIVHRDLKPSNILVKRKPNGKIRLKIIDFGIGGLAATRQIEKLRDLSSQGFLMSTALQGSHTPLYASPEQIRGNPPDPRDDVHALGVIWYQMVTGDLTAGAPTGLDWVSELAARGMTDEHIAVFASCFASRSERRPRDAAVLAEELARILPDLPDPKTRKRQGVQWSVGSAMSLASRWKFWKADNRESPDAKGSSVLSSLAGRENRLHGRPDPPSAMIHDTDPGRKKNHKDKSEVRSAAPGSARQRPEPDSKACQPIGRMSRDGQGVAIVGQVNDDGMALRLLITALRQQGAAKTRALTQQLEGALRIGYFSRQLIWSLSKHCHGDPQTAEIARAISRKIFGRELPQLLNDRDMPVPDLDTAEREYELWRGYVCRASSAPKT